MPASWYPLLFQCDRDWLQRTHQPREEEEEAPDLGHLDWQRYWLEAVSQEMKLLKEENNTRQSMKLYLGMKEEKRQEKTITIPD